jgi:predicted CopG family antitoxin
MNGIGATTISASQETRKLLRSLKAGGETYDDVIRALIVSHPNRLTMAELYRRVREGGRRPIEHLAAKSRRQSCQ